LDVSSVDQVPDLPIDHNRVCSVMVECEKYVNLNSGLSQSTSIRGKCMCVFVYKWHTNTHCKLVCNHGKLFNAKSEVKHYRYAKSQIKHWNHRPMLHFNFEFTSRRIYSAWLFYFLRITLLICSYVHTVYDYNFYVGLIIYVLLSENFLKRLAIHCNLSRNKKRKLIWVHGLLYLVNHIWRPTNFSVIPCLFS